MTSPLLMVVLVMLVAEGEDEAVTQAAARSARAALPPSSTVIVRRTRNTDDATALTTERSEAAGGVAIVTSTDAARRRVRLRVHRREDEVWLDREIVFEGADDPAERGRTLGFALASMFPDGVPADATRPSPPGSDPPLPPTSPRAPDVVTPGVPSRPRRGLIDAVAIAGLGLGGYAGGVGGRTGFGYSLGARTTLRLDGSFRSAEVPPAQSTAMVLTGGPGLSFDLLPLDGRFLGLGLRFAALVMMHAQSHLSDESAPVRQYRWLPGAQLALEATFRLSDAAAILLSGGSEAAFGRLDIYLHSRRVAEVPPFRLMSDLGVRVRF